MERELTFNDGHDVFSKVVCQILGERQFNAGVIEARSQAQQITSHPQRLLQATVEFETARNRESRVDGVIPSL